MLESVNYLQKRKPEERKERYAGQSGSKVTRHIS
jgi:hypothetical protein